MISWKTLSVFLVMSLVTGCEKPPAVKQPQAEENVLTIEHMKFGTEKFKVETAACNLYQDKDGTWEFVVGVRCKKALLRSKELEEVTDPEPNFEATVVLPQDQLELTKGRIISQEAGYDYKRRLNITNIYYFSHESIENLRIELLEITDEWIDAKVSGDAVINGSNGTKPDSRISVRARFKRDKNLKRGIS
jgi:hypothetical protein